MINHILICLYRASDNPNELEIGATDAEAIAELPSHSNKSKSVTISSPNTLWVPKVYAWERRVRARKDGRFGWDDRTLWPQYVVPGFEYLACIPRNPENPSHPLAVLWWTPRDSELIAVEGSVAVELYIISKERKAALAACQVSLTDEVKEFHKSYGIHPILGRLHTAMRISLCLINLGPMSHRDLIELIPRFQRHCLDIRAWLDFKLIFEPRLLLDEDELRKIPVSHERMGVVTESLEVLMTFWLMRVPVWILRSYLPPGHKIRSVVSLTMPKNMIEDDYEPPFEAVFDGYPCTSMHEATRQLGEILPKAHGPSPWPQPVNGGLEPASTGSSIHPPRKFAPGAPVIVVELVSSSSPQSSSLRRECSLEYVFECRRNLHNANTPI